MHRIWKVLTCAFLGVACVAFLPACFASRGSGAGNSTAEPVFSLSGIPLLSDEIVLEQLESSVYVPDPECDTTWVEHSSFHTDSSTVELLGDTTQDTIQANVTIKQSNNSFESTKTYRFVFVYRYDNWEIEDYWLETDEVVPIEGVSSDCVLNNAYSLLNMADDGAHTFSDGSPCRLADLYSSGVFAVTQNKTSKNGGPVEVSIENSNGFSSYKGIITVEFAWDNSAHYWYIDSCKANNDAYKTNLEEMIGIWQGEYVDTGDTNKKCYGGRYNPIVLTVKSADSLSGLVVADLSFLAHRHFAENNPVQTTDGDTILTLKDILINIPSETGTTVRVYDGDNYEQNVIFETYQISFTYRDDGTIGVEVRYQWNDPSSRYSWDTSGYVDNYTLVKVDENNESE